ncbi:MAG: hypothetical protein ACREMF_10705 [Gemmatimonadales bacterium]
MTANSGTRPGVLGGLAGVMLGGFTWIVVYGITLGDPAVWGAGLFGALALWIVAARLSTRLPNRTLAIFGATLLAVTAIDWLFIGLLLPRLPELPANPAIGISRSSLRPMQPILIGASVTGTVLILWDLLRRRP